MATKSATLVSSTLGLLMIHRDWRAVWQMLEIRVDGRDTERRFEWDSLTEDQMFLSLVVGRQG
jgi:hypothetical protein